MLSSPLSGEGLERLVPQAMDNLTHRTLGKGEDEMAARNQKKVLETGTVVVDEKALTVRRTVGLSGTSEEWAGRKVQLEVELDFSNASTKQLLEWSSRTLTISMQNALRQYGPEFCENLAKRGVYKRSAEMAGIVEDVDKQARNLERQLSSLSNEQAAQLLAALQAKLATSTTKR